MPPGVASTLWHPSSRASRCALHVLTSGMPARQDAAIFGTMVTQWASWRWRAVQAPCVHRVEPAPDLLEADDPFYRRCIIAA